MWFTGGGRSAAGPEHPAVVAMHWYDERRPLLAAMCRRQAGKTPAIKKPARKPAFL